jgi:hypothetical protein
MKAVETVQSRVISFLLFFLSLKRSDYIIRVQSMEACAFGTALPCWGRPVLLCNTALCAAQACAEGTALPQRGRPDL